VISLATNDMAVGAAHVAGFHADSEVVLEGVDASLKAAATLPSIDQVGAGACVSAVGVQAGELGAMACACWDKMGLVEIVDLPEVS